MRTKDNKEYSRSALNSIRAGIQRHLQSPPFNHKFSISLDKEFTEANNVLSGVIAKLKKDIKDKTTHEKEILKGDGEKLYTNVFTDTPQGLQYRVFYEIMLHLGRRGREGLHLMNKNFLKLKKDAKG